MNYCFDIFEVFRFNRADKAFEIFGPNGDSGHYNTIRRVPKRVATQGPTIISPKALRILVRICSQVPAKVQSALLVAYDIDVPKFDGPHVGLARCLVRFNVRPSASHNSRRVLVLAPKRNPSFRPLSAFSDSIRLFCVGAYLLAAWLHSE